MKETAAVVLSAARWGHLWSGKRVIVSTDNTTTMYAINKGSSRHSVIMSFLRILFWFSAYFNFDIIAKHLPGRYNVIADSASRLHESGQLSRLH